MCRSGFTGSGTTCLPGVIASPTLPRPCGMYVLHCYIFAVVATKQLVIKNSINVEVILSYTPELLCLDTISKAIIVSICYRYEQYRL